MTHRLNGGFFRSAIEDSSDCIALLDEHGRSLFVNRAAFAEFEIGDFEEHVGRPWASSWPGLGRMEIERGLAAARRGERYHFEGERPTTRGTRKWWDVSVAPVCGDSGQVAGVIATMRDITAARSLRVESELQALESARTTAAMRSAFLVAHVGGWEVDFVTRQTVFSPELCELLGSPPLPAMPSDEAEAFWCDDDRGRFRECMARVEAFGERLIFEGQSAGPDGVGKWWRLLGEPVFDESRCVALRGAGQDITEWRDTLDREQAALLAAEAMSGFLATIGHEIRTPLNGVLGMAQAMSQGDLSVHQRERLGVIQTSGEGLLSLLNDLLDLSKIQAGKVELDVGVVDTDALADGARRLFASLSQDKAVSLDLRLAPNARGCWVGDPNRVRQVLFNLISNAVKFTERGSVEVNLSYAGGQLILRVRDTGIGIMPGKLGQIFERFVQGDASTTRRLGGSGLGLTICRDLVALMGGKIDVKSIEGQGSTFTVTLPLIRAETPATIAPPGLKVEPAPSALHTLRVLAADDNKINQCVLKTLLGARGIDPVIVANGQEAFEAWRDAHWDIVLMDIQMPVLDGISAAKLMRAVERRDGRPRTPIIAVTANAMAHHAAEYAAAGMDGLIAKPIRLTTLMEAMDSALTLVKAA